MLKVNRRDSVLIHFAMVSTFQSWIGHYKFIAKILNIFGLWSHLGGIKWDHWPERVRHLIFLKKVSVQMSDRVLNTPMHFSESNFEQVFFQ